MFTSQSQKNYRKSNRILTVKLAPSKNAKELTKKLLTLKSAAERQSVGEELLDELCDNAGIDVVNLKISATRQYHKKSQGRIVFKQYGYYRPQSKYIYIQNQTPARAQIIAPKTFLDTLLHEWTHHYDHSKLKLNSIHSKGFYSRLNSIKKKLGL